MQFIQDGNSRLFISPISIEERDLDGEKMDLDSLEKLVPTLINKKRGNITYKHSDQVIGKLKGAYREGNILMGIGEIDRVYDSDDEVWKEISNLGFSVRGKGDIDDKGQIFMKELSSITLTDNPAIGKKVKAVSIAKEKGTNIITTNPILVKKETYNPEQISAGIKVEFEHTDDPYAALKIAIDHLNEDANYYTKLKEMEKESVTTGNATNQSVASPKDDDDIDVEKLCKKEKEVDTMKIKKIEPTEVKKQEGEVAPPQEEMPPQEENQEQNMLVAINQKLDKLLEALGGSIMKEEKEEPKEDEKEEVVKEVTKRVLAEIKKGESEVPEEPKKEDEKPEIVTEVKKSARPETIGTEKPEPDYLKNVQNAYK